MARGVITKRVGVRGTTYRVRVEIDADPMTGKRRWHNKSVPTRREAEALAAQILNQKREGNYRTAIKMTTGQYLEQWLDVAKASLRPGTGVRYTQTIEKHFVPAFGHIPLEKLTPSIIQAFYQRLLDKYAVGTVSVMHGILHRALEQAVKWEVLTRNPCDGVVVPKRNDPPGKVWSAETAKQFLAGTRTDKDEALWQLAVTTGMRRGELLGLLWADVDLSLGEITVRHNLARQWDLSYAIAEPKTAAGYRKIVLSAATVAALMRQQNAQGLRKMKSTREGWEWIEMDLVFDSGDGGHINPNAVTDRFAALIKSLRLPAIRLHDLRHTAATLLMSTGVNPRVAQDRLGHATLGMTLGRYSHVTDEMRREAARRLDEALGDVPPAGGDPASPSSP